MVDKNNKEIKRGDVFLYRNERGEVKPYIMRSAEPHERIKGLYHVKCYYADDPTDDVPRSMYAERAQKVTRLNPIYRAKRAKYLAKLLLRK